MMEDIAYQTEKQQPTYYGYCQTVGKLAKVMMIARQVGMPLSDALKCSDPDDSACLIKNRMVIEAYKMPRFNSDEFIQRVAEEFGNKWHLSCLESFEKEQKDNNVDPTNKF